MPRKKETLTLSVPPGTKEKLEAIAQRLNIKWGNNPSASGLVAAIAQQSVSVGQNHALTQNQVKALRQATKLLVDAGFVEEAQNVIAILLNQGDLEAPLRQMLLQQMMQPIEAWRNQIDQYIEEQQAFRVTYRNSQGTILDYQARYAEIRFYEKRFYVQIWCEETQDVEQDIPDMSELWHNRCLRLDRIQHLEPIERDWRGQFDSIKVYLHFRGWLANAYEPKVEDVENQMVNDVRQVVRTVVNPFWLIREVSRYWDECEIIAPQSLRDRVQQKLEQTLRQYGQEFGERDTSLPEN